ncbi:hypothetical protein DPMN_029430 [Dreissena polymorpha]|uniref:Uncharacterized protein n=1 Tax=Dreissena polymorpha TaxID=45954 RepID=A0A9D4RG85_DREPO|nr:hypothetical protein DPMN_029430 [Dreissena polymorpha]
MKDCLWKKANIQGIKQHLQAFSSTFFVSETGSIENEWSKFKSAITSSVNKFVPSKMSSTHPTHPWVDTDLRCLTRRLTASTLESQENREREGLDTIQRPPKVCPKSHTTSRDLILAEGCK